MPQKSVVGIKQRTTLEPILKLDGARVIAQANLVQFNSIMTLAGYANVILPSLLRPLLCIKPMPTF